MMLPNKRFLLEQHVKETTGIDIDADDAHQVATEVLIFYVNQMKANEPYATVTIGYIEKGLLGLSHMDGWLDFVEDPDEECD